MTNIIANLAIIAACITFIVLMLRGRQKKYTPEDVEAIEAAWRKSTASVSAASRGLS